MYPTVGMLCRVCIAHIQPMKHVLYHADHRYHDHLDHPDPIPAVMACCAGSVLAQMQPMKHAFCRTTHTDHDLDHADHDLDQVHITI